MPVRKRVDKRRQAVTDEIDAWLLGHDKESGFVKYLPSEELAALWSEHSERIIEEHIVLQPGTRPARWWNHDAPRIPVGTFPGMWYDGLLSEPRKRIGGTGTAASDVLAYMPTFSFGLPSIWITRSDVKYYSGLAVDIHGSQIGGELAIFDGVAIDSDDPPTFESQSSYLNRHGLFLPGEIKRLKKADWAAEVIPKTE
jgi:hypothetical protein